MKYQIFPLRLFSVAMCLVVVVSALCQPSFGKWQATEIIRTFWCEPPADDVHLQRLRNESFSLTWCPERAVDRVSQNGLKAMIHNEQLLKPFVLSDQGKLKRLDSMIESVRNKPGLAGYWVADEPKQAELKALGQLLAHIRAKDPNHFAYVNALPIYAFSLQEYTQYLEAYMSELKPAIFSFAHYPFYKSYDLPQYFQNLETVSAACRKHNVPFIGIIQACTYDPNWRLVNPDELRWFVYSNLAYGAKGISYFLYWGPKKFGGIYQDDLPTPLLKSVVALNKELESLSPVLVSLRTTAVYHSAPLPLGTTGFPKNSPITVPNRGHAQFLISLMQSPTGKNYALIVNRDYNHACELTLQLTKAKLTSEYDRSTKSFKQPPSNDWFGNPKVRLSPGDARLFVWTSS